MSIRIHFGLMSRQVSARFTLAAVLMSLVLVGCSRPTSSEGGSSPRVNSACIKPDANARNNILTAIFEANAGDTVLLCEGKFNMPTGLLINSKPGLTLKGAGMKKTF